MIDACHMRGEIAKRFCLMQNPRIDLTTGFFESAISNELLINCSTKGICFWIEVDRTVVSSECYSMF
jgi:hypothetical protein